MDLDISLSRLYTVNKSSHSLKHRGFSEKKSILAIHIYTMHIIFEENTVKITSL